MSGFHGRRGPALFPNIANLNAIPSDPTDYNMFMQTQQDGYELEQELALFTNTQFFDFDSMSGEGFEGAPQTRESNFNAMGEEFQIPDLGLHSTLQSNTTPPMQQQQQQQQQQHRHQQQQLHQFQPSFPPTTSSSPTSSTTGAHPASEKRKIDTFLDSGVTSPIEDSSRVAADEDKRRRNTAASARFRAKKKQREEAMEKTAKEMTEKVTHLENRINKLEMENKLLKDLITEKSGKEVDVAELYRRFTKNGKEAAPRKTESQASTSTVAQKPESSTAR